jgi:hypothetical protein
MSARRSRVKHLLACLVAACAAAQAGCGSSENGLAAQVTNAPAQLALLRAEDVRRLPPGSPERTVFEWWRLMQFRQAADALKLFAPDVRAQLLRTNYAEAAVTDFGPSLTHLQPRVMSVDRGARHAVVYLSVLSKQKIGSKVTRQAVDYLGLALDRFGNRWLLSDSSYFRVRSQSLRVARQRAEQAAPRQP